MSKLSPGRIRYLKAQLLNLMRPAFLGSLGVIILSGAVLVQLFRNPEQFLGQGDKTRPIANTEAGSRLTPEEQARAAEIDDLSVLLKELDSSGALSNTSIAVGEQSGPEAVAELEDNIRKRTQDVADSAPASVSAPSAPEAALLPTLNTTGSTNTSALLFGTNQSGFSGFNPMTRSTGPVTGPDSRTDRLDRNEDGSRSALQTAIDRTPGLAGQVRPIQGNASSTVPTSSPTTTLPGNPSSAGNVTVGNPNVPQPVLPTTPNALRPGTAGAPTATTPVDNAFTQILNPSAPAPLNTAPFAAGSVPAATTAQPNVNYAGGTQGIGGPVQQPVAIPQPPALPGSAAAPVAPAQPFSVPYGAPGQSIGGGQIRTFSNP